MKGKKDEAKAAAKAAGEMFYTGDVCKRHAELAGRRRTSNGNCPGCIRDRMKRHKKKNRKAINRRQLERRAAIKAGALVPRKYRKASVPRLTDDSQTAANQSVCGHETR